MAKIIENKTGRRMVEVSTDDIISIVREYQNTIQNTRNYDEIRKKLDKRNFYLPEEV